MDIGWILFSALLFFSTGIMSLLARKAWLRRESPGLTAFAGLCVSLAIYSLGYGFETLARPLEVKIFWLQFENLGIHFIGPFFFLFALDFTQLGNQRLNWLRPLLFIIPLITIFLVFSPFRELHYASLTATAGGPLMVGRGPWYFVAIAHTYLWLLSGFFVLTWGVYTAPALFRQQYLVTLIAALATWIPNIYYFASGVASGKPVVDITPLAISASGLIIGFGALRLRLFDLVPIALNQVFDHLAEMVLVLDNQLRLVDANPAACQQLGLVLQADAGRSIQSILADQTDFLQAVEAAIIQQKDRSASRVEYSTEKKHPSWYELSTTPLFNRTGQKQGFVLMAKEITAQKKLETQLRELEGYWRKLLEFSPNPMIITDAEGKITQLNREAERMFGYQADELAGKTIEVLVPTHLREKHMGYRENFTGDRNPHTTGTRTLTGQTKDGSIIPIEIHLNSIETPYGRSIMISLHDLMPRDLLNAQVRLLSLGLEAAANGVSIADRNGICLWINPAFTAMTGYRAAEIVGKKLSILKSGVHDNSFYKTLWDTILSGQVWRGEIVNRHRDGHLYTEEQTITPVRNEEGEIAYFIAIKQDITERKQMESDLLSANTTLRTQLNEIETLQAQMEELIIRDPLTGLLNRRYLAEKMDELAQSASREKPISVILMDLDLFKDVNDRYGHRAGDKALVELAGVLRHHTRADDLVCRYGGEEFLVVLMGADLRVARQRAEQFRQAVAALDIEHQGRVFRISLSAGVASCPVHGVTGEDLLLAADRALYQAKDAGRNCVVVYSKEIPGNK